MTEQRSRYRRTHAQIALKVVSLAVLISGCSAAAASAAADVSTSAGVTHSDNPRVPEGAAWSQEYFPSADDTNTELHADVLLPEGLGDGEKVTPIVSIGPYFSHIGQVSPEGHTQAGPSKRFTDLISEGKALERGYAVVLVDGRGFGGSTGCQDAGGPGERADVTAAIEWAAAQPWSTGQVGMFGKSYDAMTGLIGNNLGLDPLGAVVAQEPIWDLERNFWSGGIPRATTVSIGTVYGSSAWLPGMPDDEARYQANAALIDPACRLQYMADLTSADPGFWDQRDFASLAKGTDTPLLVTQGFTEWNTEAEGMREFLDNHEGPERAWLGPWDHVRGNDADPANGALLMGRAGWYDEVFAFYDEHLKGAAARPDLPAFAVQDNTGAWRSEKTWPSTDVSQRIQLDNGRYLDNGGTRDSGNPEGDPNSFINWSTPVTTPTRVTGTPELTFTAQGHGNVLVRLYDVAPDGTATWFNEQAAAVVPGSRTVELRSNDWTLAEGHQLAIEIGTIPPAGANPHLSNDWIDSPSGTRIHVSNPEISLQLDNPAEDAPTQGDRAKYLDTYLVLAKDELAPTKGTFVLGASGH
ncbi:CocE/NonD family hydrolase [Pengzhenrongella sicca]|uniref:CocE/NonD family hydrolase n=1 Tax=Pengzhenrongella sicca TaxID=2819238 RepID=A0A8A4ZJ51_9MICO|nr:CocE/NonD family hydrolase [Pengzhenrongella sicca]QTE31063.1 CocE/NonD family hydrolase [Pengzhenrongella sicca]